MTAQRDGDLAHVLVEVVDENGLRVPLADNMVTCHCEGGRLLGLEGTGNTDMSHPRATERRASSGRVLAYVSLADGTPARLRFTSPLLDSAEISL